MTTGTGDYKGCEHKAEVMSTFWIIFEGRVALDIARIHVRPVFDEQTRNFQVTIYRRRMEGTPLPTGAGDYKGCKHKAEVMSACWIKFRGVVAPVIS